MTTETQGITPKDNINQAHIEGHKQPQILRIKTGALCVPSPLRTQDQPLRDQAIRAELLAPTTSHLLQTNTQYTKPSPKPQRKRQKQKHNARVRPKKSLIMDDLRYLGKG